MMDVPAVDPAPLQLHALIPVCELPGFAALPEDSPKDAAVLVSIAEHGSAVVPRSPDPGEDQGGLAVLDQPGLGTTEGMPHCEVSGPSSPASS
ncbi:hypothetical protein AOB60_05540 [Streptomyces noursei]|uniref:Uncharacterized protein n=1 Tax=Streptomyces noursei TaxID=1971 RepID=A0A2N8PHA5_STRNR|nr:hypothetical protein AOB60_05540 [Streptomyces noursei]